MTISILPLFGGDSGEDDDENKPKPSDMAQQVKTGIHDDDDDDDDEDESLKLTAEQKRIMELSKENKQKRLENKRLNALLAEKAEADKKAADGKLDDLAAATKALEESNARGSKLEETLRKNLLRTAILEDTRYTWHDVDTLVKSLDLEAIDVDPETGKVDGLKEELKRVAVEKAFLVKKDSSKRQDAEGRGRSGHNPGTTPDKDDESTQRAALINKYPVLKNRR